MKAKRRFQPVRRSLGLPTLVLVALSCGLWAGWAALQPTAEPPQQQTKTRIRFVEMVDRTAPSHDDLLVFMAPTQPDLRMAEDLPAGLGTSVLEARPHLLVSRVDSGSELANLSLLPPIRRQARRRLIDYRPVWPINDPFPSVPLESMRLDVQVSPGLASCGFVFPSESMGRVAGGERAWDLVFDVTCGTDGRPRDVLLLSAPDPLGVSSNVVRILYQGESAPGMTGRGRVTVRWGKAGPATVSPGVEKEQVWPPKL